MKKNSLNPVETVFFEYLREQTLRPMERAFFDDFSIETITGFTCPIITGGASGGSCWDTGEDEGAVEFTVREEKRADPTFEVLQALLVNLLPKSGGQVFKTCLREIRPREESETVREYYGNYTNFIVYTLEWEAVAQLMAKMFTAEPKVWLEQILLAPEREVRLLGNALAGAGQAQKKQGSKTQKDGRMVKTEKAARKGSRN